jgi:hypothetical protein
LSSKEDGEFLHLPFLKWTLVHVEEIDDFHIITLLQGYERNEAGAEFCEASEWAAALGADDKDTSSSELVKIADALSGNGLDGHCAYIEKMKCHAT